MNNNDWSNVYKYRIGSHTSSIGRPPNFYPSGLLRSHGCTFASVYAVTEDTAKAVGITAGTAAGFKGVVWSEKLWVDCDTEEAANQTRQFLKEKGYDHVEYDTGNRGRHFGIARPIDPSHILPGIDKAWVAENLPWADKSLYWHLHLIRLPGTIHERTGHSKRLVSRQSGQPLILSNVLSDSTEYVPKEQTGGRSSIFKHWPVVSRLTGPNVNGSRHHHLLELVLALKNDCVLSMDESMWVVREVNRGFEEPKSEEEVEKIVRWVYEKE